MAGRKPKPTALKLVTGNPGRRPLNTREPKPRRMIPSPPTHLSARALVAWGSFSVMLDRLGLLTEADALAFEQLCENYAEVIELRTDIAAHGRFQKVLNGQGDEMERVRPAQKQLADAERRFRGMLGDFGLSPSARARVHAIDETHDDDPAKKYFG